MSSTDQIYSQRQDHVVDFVFDKKVVDVFGDMIRRSIPGYESILSMLPVLGSQYIKNGTNVYDIGCSLGAGLMAISARIKHADIPPGVHYHAVDPSPEMLEKCRHNLASFIPVEQLTLVAEPIQNLQMQNASLVLMNFTLQFVPPEDRLDAVGRIYRGLNPGGVLLLSEKWHSEDSVHEEELAKLHHRFKSMNGYSDLEISQKRSALEKVMITDSFQSQCERLRVAGFAIIIPWFQCLNFASILAIK